MTSYSCLVFLWKFLPFPSENLEQRFPLTNLVNEVVMMGAEGWLWWCCSYCSASEYQAMIKCSRGRDCSCVNEGLGDLQPLCELPHSCIALQVPNRAHFKFVRSLELCAALQRLTEGVLSLWNPHGHLRSPQVHLNIAATLQCCDCCSSIRTLIFGPLTLRGMAQFTYLLVDCDPQIGSHWSRAITTRDFLNFKNKCDFQNQIMKSM